MLFNINGAKKMNFELSHENFSFYQNVILGREFTINQDVESQSNCGYVLVKKGTKATCLSFQIDSLMICKFMLDGKECIGAIEPKFLTLTPLEETNLLFKTVKLTNEAYCQLSDTEKNEKFYFPLSNDDYINHKENTTIQEFLVLSFFEKDDKTYAFLLPKDEEGDFCSYNAFTALTTDLILI